MNFGKSRKNISCTRLYPGRISGKKSVKKKKKAVRTGPVRSEDSSARSKKKLDRSKKKWTGPDRLPTLVNIMA